MKEWETLRFGWEGYCIEIYISLNSTLIECRLWFSMKIRDVSLCVSIELNNVYIGPGPHSPRFSTTAQPPLKRKMHRRVWPPSAKSDSAVVGPQNALTE